MEHLSFSINTIVRDEFVLFEDFPVKRTVPIHFISQKKPPILSKSTSKGIPFFRKFSSGRIVPFDFSPEELVYPSKLKALKA